MEEIFTHINTKKDCEGFIEEIKSMLKQVEGRVFRLEMFFQKHADTQVKCKKQIQGLKMELAHIHDYFNIIACDDNSEGLQLKKLKIELKIINLERELSRYSIESLIEKHLDLRVLKHKIKFLNSVLKLAQKRKSEF